jgi:hypothetical protein
MSGGFGFMFMMAVAIILCVVVVLVYPDLPWVFEEVRNYFKPKKKGIEEEDEVDYSQEYGDY